MKKIRSVKSLAVAGTGPAVKSGSFPRPMTARSTPAKPASGPAESTAPRWTFLTNHSHVLILISRNPDVVLRHVAIQVGITERAVQRIIADLEEAGMLEREKVGRQNHYRILADRPLRHAIESHRTIGDLISLMNIDAP